MADTTTDIEIIQGATFKMQVTWADPSTDPATPISLAGYYAHMQIRSKAGAVGTPLLNLTSNDDSAPLQVEPDGAVGVVTVRISAVDTATLTKNCAYDLFVIKTADPTEATRLVSGAVTLSKSVTINSVG